MKRDLGILLLLFAIGLSLVPFVAEQALPSEARGEYAVRRLNDTVLWGGDEAGISLVPAPFPTPPADASPQPLDIVFLLDASQSMEGIPLQRSVEAIETFLQQIDLTVHRVAILVFSGQVDGVQTLTGDLSRLQALLRSASAQNGTAIDAALHAAREVLKGEQRRSDALALIFLLSDGGSDPNAALEEAHLASQEGIPIAVIGFRGADFNEALLQQMATSGYYWLAETPEDFSTILQFVATQLNQLVAADVIVQEPLYPDFEVVEGSTVPLASVLPQGIEWQLAWIAEESFQPEGIVFSYRVHPKHYGLHRITNVPGSISWRDYTGMSNQRTTPEGPYILVLPSFFFLLVPLFLLPGVVLFAWPWIRRQKKITELASQEQEAPPPSILLPPVSDQAFQEWLARAQPLQPPSGWAKPSWLRKRAAFFIGVGYVGEQVLARLADYLDTRWGERWPSHIRLLHIAVTEEEEQIRRSTKFPSVRLCLDRQRRERLPFTKHIGLNWFDQKYIGRPGRALGRLALFADLMEGKHQSRLWPALSAGFSGLDDVSVYIISDAFSDEASGMLIDIAHMARQLAPRNVMVTLCLAAQHAKWQDELSDTQRGERTFATLREIQRLQRKTPVRFPYAPGLGQRELDAVSEVTLFDELFLFDGLGEETADGYRHDISQWEAKDALLPAIAECMIALLEHQISEQYYADWKNEASKPLRAGEIPIPLETLAGAMGAYTVRFPIEEMRRVLEARLVHQLLFDRTVGLIGWEELDAEGQPRRRGDLSFPISDKDEVENFFNRLGIPSTMVHRVKKEEFRRFLLAYLEEQLNQPSGLRLRCAQKFLTELCKAVPSWAEEWKEIQEAIQSWTLAVGEEPKQADQESMPLFLDLRSSPKEAGLEYKPGPLYLAWQAKWKQARAQMEKITRLPACQALCLRTEGELFDRYLLPDRPLERMRGQIWWRWIERGGKLKLGLLILPPQLDEPEPQPPHRTLRERIFHNPALIARTADEPEKVIESLMHMARGFSHRLTEVDDLRTFLAQGDLDQLARELERGATPLHRQQMKGVNPIPIQSFRYLAGPGIGEEHELTKKISALMTAQSERDRDILRHPCKPFSTEDSTECRLLHVKHNLLIDNMTAYAEAKKKYYPRPELQIFREEQIAAQWEEKARRKMPPDVALAFSPSFVEQIVQHGEALHLFGQCLVYGLLDLGNTLQVSAAKSMEGVCPNLSHMPIDRALELFIACLEKEPERLEKLQSLLHQQKPRKYTRLVETLDRVRDELVRPLSKRAEPQAQDMALLLAKVIWDEERTAG